MMIKEEKKQMFGQLLVGKKMVNEHQIEEALEIQKVNGKALGDVLIDLGHTTSDLIMSVLNITRKTEQKLARLFNASIGMLLCNEQAPLLNFVITEAERILESDMCNLFLVDEENNEFKCFYVHNGETGEVRLPLGSGLAGYVAKASETINLEDAYQSPLFDPQLDNMLEYKTETVLSIPMKRRDNKVIGVLQVVNKKGKGQFTSHDEWLFKSFAIFASNAIAMINSNKNLSQEVRFNENIERFNLAVENLSEGVIIITEDDDSVVVNPAVKWLLGRKINRDIDKQNTIALLNSSGLSNISRWLKGEVDTLTSKEITFQALETRVIRVDCIEINGDINNKRKKGCLVVFKDITRDKEFQQVKSEFITVASHELLSPITSMKNSVNLLLQEIPGPNTDAQKRFLHIINDGVEYLTNLTASLLDIAMSEIRKVPLKREKVDLSKVIKSAMESQWFKAEEKEISLVNSNGNTSHVLADSNRIRQVLLNLLDNAFKFTNDGGEVVVSTKSMEDKVEISVKDNGSGIFLEEQDKIFERFYQVENAATKKHYGIGLGLSICKDIVEAQGGRIWVESKERGGSNFVFTLPLYK
jgi:signal transduction histidine kinase